MVKILLTGFRHSGTTMLMQLLRAHPQVGWIEFEESYIDMGKTKEWVLMMAKKRVPNLKKEAWGEKIPWGTRLTDKNGQRAINMTKKWLKFFRKEARVIQILRHPLDVLLSSGGLKISQKELKHTINSIEKVIEFMNLHNRCGVMIYENLVTNPEIRLINLFDFLQLNSTEKVVNKVINTKLKFGKINADRAYAYIKKNIQTDVNYAEMTKNIKNLI